MVDWMIGRTLSLVIMTMIVALAATALICAHWGLLALIGGAAGQGARILLAAAALAVAAGLMIRHRNDLVDR